MIAASSWERQLPPIAEDALETLSVAAENATEAKKDSDDEDNKCSRTDFTKDEATAILAEAEEFS